MGRYCLAVQMELFSCESLTMPVFGHDTEPLSIKARGSCIPINDTNSSFHMCPVLGSGNTIQQFLLCQFLMSSFNTCSGADACPEGGDHSHPKGTRGCRVSLSMKKFLNCEFISLLKICKLLLKFGNTILVVLLCRGHDYSLGAFLSILDISHLLSSEA